MPAAMSQTVCEWAQATPLAPAPHTKVGLALASLGKLPINGLRHEPTTTTNGWYIWCGTDLSSEPDFFAPLHIEHIHDYLPQVVKYLELPPGYRFLTDGQDYEDVWFDVSLLDASPSK